MHFEGEFISLRSLNQGVKQHFQALIGGDKCGIKPICPYLYTLLGNRHQYFKIVILHASRAKQSA